MRKTTYIIKDEKGNIMAVAYTQPSACVALKQCSKFAKCFIEVKKK